MAKTVAQLRRRVTHLGFEAVRRPGVMFLHSLRKIPVVRNRVIPALLKEELDGIPASDAVDAVRREFERLRKTRGPIVIGPWIGEVGFELLYWIPFLNRALRTYKLEDRRLVVVSRGGAGHWYRHLTSEYVDVFSLFTLDEYRQANEARWSKAGHQKQSPRRADGRGYLRACEREGGSAAGRAASPLADVTGFSASTGSRRPASVC